MNIKKIKEVLKSKERITIISIILGVTVIAAGSIIVYNESQVSERKVTTVTNKKEDIKINDKTADKIEKKNTEIEEEKVNEDIKVEDKKENEEKDREVELLYMNDSKDEVKRTSYKEGKENNNSKSSNNTSTSKPSTSGSTSVNKPSTSPTNGNTSSNKPSSGSTSTNKPSTGGNTSTSTPNKPSEPSKPSHSHDWVAETETVHHKEEGHWEDIVINPAWTEEIPVYEDREVAICNGCGADITSDPTTHNRNHAINGEKGGWHTEWQQIQVGVDKIEYPAVTDTKWVVDKAAWTETVTKGYKCSCGATK